MMNNINKILEAIDKKFEDIKVKINEIKNKNNQEPEEFNCFSNRLEDIINYYNEKNNNTDYNLIVQQDLSNMDDYLSNISSNLSNYNTIRRTNCIVNINTYLDSFVKILNTFPYRQKEEVRGNLNQIISGFKRQFESIEKKLSQKEINFTSTLTIYKEKLSSLEEEKNKLEIELKKQNENISNALVNFNEKFTKDQNQRNDLNSDEIKKFKDRVEEVIEIQNNKLSQTEKESLNAFNKFLKEIEEKESNSFNKLFEEIKDNSNETVKSIEIIEKNKEKSEELLGIVGKNTYAGNYKIYADKAKKFSNTLFWISFAFMFVAALSFILPIFKEIYEIISTNKATNTFFWKNLLYRLPVSVILLIPSFYLAIESRKQREIENKYRDFEIKISAVSPYMKDIGDEEITEKDKVKLELAKKFFGKEYKEKYDKNIIIPDEIVKIGLKILDKIK